MFSFWHFFFKCPKAPEKSLNFLLAIPCTCSDLLTWSSNFSGILRYRVDFQSMELDDDYGNGFIDSDDDDQNINFGLAHVHVVASERTSCSSSSVRKDAIWPFCCQHVNTTVTPSVPSESQLPAKLSLFWCEFVWFTQMAKEWNLRQCFWCSCLRPQICVRFISRSIIIGLIVEGKNKDLFAVLPKHKANNGTFLERSNNSKLVHSLNRMQQLRCQSPSLGNVHLAAMFERRIAMYLQILLKLMILSQLYSQSMQPGAFEI